LYLCLYVVLSCVGRGLSDGLVQRVLPSVLIRLRNFRCEAAKVLTRTVEPLIIMIGSCGRHNECNMLYHFRRLASRLCLLALPWWRCVAVLCFGRGTLKVTWWQVNFGLTVSDTLKTRDCSYRRSWKRVSSPSDLYLAGSFSYVM
jgi:hypothetical protein